MSGGVKIQHSNNEDQSLSRERAFLFAAVRAVLSGESGGSAGWFDWRVLLEEAAYHGVSPLLWRFLDAGGAGTAPPEVLAALHRTLQENLGRNLGMTGELWRIVEAFKAHGIAAIPFKGPTLAMLAYGDLAWRQFGDLDILVDRHEVAPAAEALCARGYEPEFPLRAALSEQFLTICNALSFRCAPKRMLVELHWELSPNLLPFKLGRERLRERLTTVAPGGKELPTLAPEHLLLYICAHGARHCWERLSWIADVAGLINRHPQLDWDAVAAQARAAECERVLFLGLLLASDPAGVRLPPEIERSARADTDAAFLAARTRNLLAQPLGTALPQLEQHRYYLKLQDTPAHRLSYLYRLFLTPNIADWESLPLPKPLTFLYPFVRATRLLREKITR